jgi:hypothetical protein
MVGNVASVMYTKLTELNKPQALKFLTLTQTIMAKRIQLPYLLH